MNAALPQATAAQLEAWDNPMGLMGFEFIEFTSPTPGVGASCTGLVWILAFARAMASACATAAATP